jgi:toxin CptA
MSGMQAPAVWLAAALCVGLMGFAIQRGGTCTVAAVDELLTQRRAQRLLAMGEASLWVAGGLALAQWLHLAHSMPAAYALGVSTVFGGALLGLGAWVNRACVFGAVARLGSGEWAYLLTPLGFFFGCVIEMSLLPRPAPGAAASGGMAGGADGMNGVNALWAAVFAAYALWRLWPGLRTLWAGTPLQRAQVLAHRVWAPHAATIVIGISFVATLLLAGRWAYTDVLADLAAMMAARLPQLPALPLLLLAALYAGALWGGATAGRWRPWRIAPAQALRCLAGGVLMGFGSLLIPGSNDGLILVGLPLLRPYAWAAFAAMVAAIALAMRLQRAWQARSAPVARPAG